MKKLILSFFALALMVSPLAFAPPIPNHRTIANSLQRPVDPIFILPLPDPKPIPRKETVETAAKPITAGMADPFDLIDVERTYNDLIGLFGREPTMEEISYMTLSTEFWGVVYRNQELVKTGTEAWYRAKYHFCKIDGCSKEELFKFLSGYQVWFGRHGKTDEDTFRIAQHLYNMLVNRNFYDTANGNHLKKIASRITDIEYAQKMGFDSGLRLDRPWQWFGPFPTGGKVDADKCTKIGEGQRFCFFTYAQTLKFSP